VLGTLVAFGAALAFGVGSVLQKVGAPPSEALGLRRVVAHMLRSPTYLLGTGLDLVGFVLTAVAARQLTQFAVEGILSTSVGITAVLAAWILGEQLRPRAKLAVALMVVGLVLLSFSAAPSTGTTVGLPLAALAVSGVGLLVAVAVVDRCVRSSVAPPLLAAAAGVAFGAWAAVPRLTYDGAPANAVGALFVIVGLVSYGAALRRGSATSVMAVTVAAEAVLPALVGLAVGDQARPGAGWAAIAGFGMAVASAIAIAVLDRGPSESESIEPVPTTLRPDSLIQV
jgi:drug/metabolite transporter (DMT)-like permease